MGTAKEEWDKLSEEEQQAKLKEALKGKPREERLAEQERENLKKSPVEWIFRYLGGKQTAVTPEEYRQLCLDRDPLGHFNDLPNDLTYKDAEYVVEQRVKCNTKNFGGSTNNDMLLGWEQQLSKDPRLVKRSPNWRSMMLQAIMARVTDDEPDLKKSHVVDVHKVDEEFLAETFHNIKDPHGIPQHDPGAKNDMEKVRMDLIFGGFPRALQAIGQVATMGARKYSDGGWLHVPDGKKRYFAAMQRHFLADMMEEANDAESGLSHLAHAAWNAMAILELQLRDLEKARVTTYEGPPLMNLHEEAFRKNNDFRNVDTGKEFTGTGEYD